jgi:hypothetical protein
MSYFFDKVLQYMRSYRVERSGNRRLLRVRLNFNDFDQLERDGYLNEIRDLRLNDTRLGVSGIRVVGTSGQYANATTSNIAHFWDSFKASRESGDYSHLARHFQWYAGSGTKGIWEDITRMEDFDDYHVTVDFALDKNLSNEDVHDFIDNFDDYETARQLHAAHNHDQESVRFTDRQVQEYYKSKHLNDQNVIHNSQKEIRAAQIQRRRKREQVKWMQMPAAQIQRRRGHIE